MGPSWEAASAPGAALEAVSPEAPLEAAQGPSEHSGNNQGGQPDSEVRAEDGVEAEDGEQGGGACVCILGVYRAAV